MKSMLIHWASAQWPYFVVGVATALTVYFIYGALSAWWETRNTPRTEFFTCDKHGAFPMKWTIEAPMPQGDVHRVCPFCFDAAFKKAEEYVQAKHTTLG